MKVEIKLIEGNKIVVDNNGKEEVYFVEDFVKPHLKIGKADINLNQETKKINFVKNNWEDSKPIKTKRFIPASNIKEKNENIIDIKGKNFMTYAGLLDLAHKKGEFSMEIIDSWVNENMTKAWCKVRLKSGNQVFDGFGSSTPENTGKMTSTYPIEMAHTRAKGRALRDYLNIGEAIKEELS